AARTLAAALNCADPIAPCGECSSCDRCARGAHPAYWEFAPVGATHRVADVRDQWLPIAFRTAVDAAWKVLRIIDADRLNESAANAFLKGLEEPPARTVWILEMADPDELPDTILSRCRLVRFSAWGPSELDAEAARLKLEPGEDRDLAVRACLGSPGALERLAAPGGIDALREHRAIIGRLRAQGPGYALAAAKLIDDEAKRRAAAIKAEGRAELAELAELYSDQAPRAVVKQAEERQARREREARTAVAQAALDDLVAWCRDCLMVAAGGDPADAINADAAQALAADARALGQARLLQTVDLLLGVREDLELNVQQTLALEAMFLQISALALPPH
ncbi:MAG TPA: hypothetical protein VML96_07950, partial [Egibacteraceae bacterium]|nr:hypothetical protein [Egibacteraceae bacterium]